MLIKKPTKIFSVIILLFFPIVLNAKDINKNNVSYKEKSMQKIEHNNALEDFHNSKET